MKRIVKSTLSMARWLLVSTLICGSAVVVLSCGNMDNALEEIINGNPTAKGISFAQSKVAVHFGDDTFTNALTNKGDGTVTYTSSNTAVATVNPTTGEVTPVDLGTTTITATVTESGDYTYETKTASYELSVGVSILKWDETLKEMKTEEVTSGVTLTGTIDNTTITAGTYIIYGNATITGDVTLTDDVELILLDKSKLDITGQVNGLTNRKALTIYAQSEGTSMGQLNVTRSGDDAISLDNNLTIHGGKIIAESTSDGSHGIYTFLSDIKIYGGDVTAMGGDNTDGIGGNGIIINGYGYSLLITGKAIVKATGGNTSGSNTLGYDSAGNGIDAYVTVSGQASVTATGGSASAGNNNGGYGIYYITIEDNAYVKAQGGSNHGTSTFAGCGIETGLIYKGGRFEIYGGKFSLGHYRWALDGIQSINNQTSNDIIIQTNNDDGTWPSTPATYTLNGNTSYLVGETAGLQKNGWRKL